MQWLKNQGPLGTMEALNWLGIYRLAAVIHDLRSVGHRIETEKRGGNTFYTLAKGTIKG